MRIDIDELREALGEKKPDEKIEIEREKVKLARERLELEKQYMQAEANFMAIEKQAKAAQDERDRLRGELLKLFEAQGIKSWDNGKVLVTYIPPTDRLSVDSKKLKENHPTVYSEAYRDWETDRKSTRLNSSHSAKSRMPSSA